MQLKEDLDLEEGCQDREWMLILCSKEDKEKLRDGFAQFNTKYLVRASHNEEDGEKNESKDDHNRI